MSPISRGRGGTLDPKTRALLPRCPKMAASCTDPPKTHRSAQRPEQHCRLRIDHGPRVRQPEVCHEATLGWGCALAERALQPAICSGDSRKGLVVHTELCEWLNPLPSLRTLLKSLSWRSAAHIHPSCSELLGIGRLCGCRLTTGSPWDVAWNCSTGRRNAANRVRQLVRLRCRGCGSHCDSRSSRRPRSRASSACPLGNHPCRTFARVSECGIKFEDNEHISPEIRR